MKLQDGMLLYHGSYTAVEKIDLTWCEVTKDFGKGFYLTPSLLQARNFIKTSWIKARAKGKASAKQNVGFVNCYRYHCSEEEVPYFEFTTADSAWLWFIAYNRRQKVPFTLVERLDKQVLTSEIIVGKIANDTTNPVITAYLSGIYGDIAGESAAGIAISLLLPDRLSEQYCFKSRRAISCLEFVEVYEYGF